FISTISERWAEWKADRARAAEQAESKREKTPKKQTIVTEKPNRAQQLPMERTAEKPVGRVRQESSSGEPVVAGLSPRASSTKASQSKSGTLAFNPAEFPSSTLLQAAAAAISVNEDELRERARSVEEKAREFEVVGTIQHIHPGPVVTTFEFKPEPG